MEELEARGICLDTSALIAYLKNREPGATAVDKAIDNLVCYVAAMSVYELLFGVARARQSIGEEALLGALNVLPFDAAVAHRAATLHDQLIRHNADIGVKDVIIAATCLEHSVSLLTLNARHFTRVPTLQVLTPDEFLALPS